MTTYHLAHTEYRLISYDTTFHELRVLDPITHTVDNTAPIIIALNPQLLQQLAMIVYPAKAGDLPTDFMGRAQIVTNDVEILLEEDGNILVTPRHQPENTHGLSFESLPMLIDIELFVEAIELLHKYLQRWNPEALVH